MRRTLIAAAVLVVVAVAAALTYQAVARDRDYRALIARGDQALHDDQTFGAIEAYSGAIALRPDSMLAHLRRGESYRRRGELDAAARDFRAAATLDPTATRPLEALGDVFYQLQRFDRAAESYSRDLALDDRSPGVSYKLALARFRAGDVNGALTTVTATLALNDRRADAQYLLGLCLREKQRSAEAIRALENAVALAPSLVPAHEELADLYITSGRTSDALAELQAIARLDREHVERDVSLGLAEAAAGQEEMAVLTLGNALERGHDAPVVFRALGKVWLDRAEAHNDTVFLNKALEALARVALDANATSEALALYGRALTIAGQNDLAEKTLEQAATRYPVDPTALTLYANAAERSAHFEAARQALIEYTALVPGDAEFVAHATRIASDSLRVNDAPTAVLWLERAADADPSDVKTTTALADAELRAGDLDGARATIARALERDPKNLTLRTLERRASLPKAASSPEPKVESP